MLPKEFKPKENYDLIRIGSDNDGGYLVDPVSITNSKYLISFGLGFDWTFEKDFLKKAKCKLYGFDIQIRKYFWFKNLIRNLEKFLLRKIKYTKLKKEILNNLECRKLLNNSNIYIFQKAIAQNNSSSNLSSIIKEFSIEKNFFLKIDIEGAEYKILDDIKNYQHLISGLVIEFHDVDLNRDMIKKFINSLETLKLIHIHPNNAGGLCENGDPKLIEMTFSANPIIIDSEVEFPHYLDQKNTEKKNDLIMAFETQFYNKNLLKLKNIEAYKFFKLAEKFFTIRFS